MSIFFASEMNSLITILFGFIFCICFICIAAMPNKNAVPEPHVGMTFQSCEELESYMEAYMHQVNQVFVVRDCVIDGPTIQRKIKLKPGLVYHKVIYKCKRGPPNHRLTSAIRKKKSLKINCPAEIRVRASYDGCVLEIYYLELEHIGHFDTKIDPVPESRRLKGENLKVVKNAIAMEAKRMCIIQLAAESFDKTVTPKDLKNIEAKLKRNSLDEISWLIDH